MILHKQVDPTDHRDRALHQTHHFLAMNPFAPIGIDANVMNCVVVTFRQHELPLHFEVSLSHVFESWSAIFANVPFSYCHFIATLIKMNALMVLDLDCTMHHRLFSPAEPHHRYITNLDRLLSIP